MRGVRQRDFGTALDDEFDAELFEGPGGKLQEQPEAKAPNDVPMKMQTKSHGQMRQQRKKTEQLEELCAQLESVRNIFEQRLDLDTQQQQQLEQSMVLLTLDAGRGEGGGGEAEGAGA